MSGPWEKYQTKPETEDGPWARYATAAQQPAAESKSDDLTPKNDQKAGFSLPPVLDFLGINKPVQPTTGTVAGDLPADPSAFNFRAASMARRLLDDQAERQQQYGTIGPIVGPKATAPVTQRRDHRGSQRQFRVDIGEHHEVVLGAMTFRKSHSLRIRGATDAPRPPRSRRRPPPAR